MGQYSCDNSSTENSANLFVLRQDIHTAYDSFRWTIVPKKVPGTLHTRWCFIYLDTPEEMGSQHYNVELRSLHGVNSYYLLAGFARAVFYLLLLFVNNYQKKWLIGQSVGTENPAGDKIGGAWAVERFPIPGTRKKSQSPKRRRPDDAEVDCCDNSRPVWNAGNKGRKSSSDCENEKDDPPPAYYSSAPPSKRLKQDSDDLNEIPCTCLIEILTGPSKSSSSTVNSPPLALADIKCSSKNCRTVAEFKRHELVRAKGLKQERAKSKVMEWWEDQLD